MTPCTLAEGEVQREGRRVLRKLSGAATKLVPHHPGSYVLMQRLGDKMRQGLRVSDVMIEAFRRRDWIRPDADDAGAFVLSDAGLGWIRRAEAGDDPFGAQHQLRTGRSLMDPEDGCLRTRTVNDGESPLGWLYKRRGADGQTMITATQFEAGEKLRRDFTLAQMTPRMGIDYSAPVLGGRRGAKGDLLLPEMVLAAKQRVRQALASVEPELAHLLLDVCCHLVGLEAAERDKGWPRRSAKIVLQIALDGLAAHYGLGGRRTPSGVRAWRAEAEDERNSLGNMG